MKKYLWFFVGIISTFVGVGGLLLKGDAPKILTASMFLVGTIFAMIAFIMVVVSRSKQQTQDTQRIISDLELLRLFKKQPGGLLSADMIAEKTELTKSEATSRLSNLLTGGLLIAGSNPTGMKYFYELSAPLEEIPGIRLSGEPFLTVEDLQEIFIAYDYKVSPHDLMVTTGLPWNMLSREMQYFRKQGVVEVAYIQRPGDSYKQYILMEQYHRSEGLDLESRTRINEEVKQVLYDENLLV
jgi:preprotein translocase subunit SecG